MKLWHDDIRPAAEGWIWARTNEAAIEHLKTGAYDELSMDHDLGLDHLDPDADPESIYFAGPSDNGCGCDLARWLAVAGPLCVPERITIHSWNTAGAQKMCGIMNDAGIDVLYRPFEVTPA
jgi:hypothetical protein